MELSQRYRKVYGDYWRAVDELILELICKHINMSDKILEIGFGSGHFLAALCDLGYKVEGIEIRKEVFESVKNSFKHDYDKIRIINDDVMLLSNNHYSLGYSTGLLQCFKQEQKLAFISHIASICNKCVYTVPLITEDRNINSREKLGVEGCVEYNTNNIGYMLSKCYGYVETGIWQKNEIGMEDSFVWFYCNNSRSNS